MCALNWIHALNFRPNAASFIGSQSQQNAEGAVGSIVNMECKTEGSCQGAAKIRGNSKQTQNIGKGGKGTLSNKGKRRKRSPDDLEFMPESIDSQTQNVKTGGQGAVKNVHNKGSKNTGPIQHIGRQTQNVAKGAHGLIHNQLNHKKRGKRSTSFIGIPFLVNFLQLKAIFFFHFLRKNFSPIVLCKHIHRADMSNTTFIPIIFKEALTIVLRASSSGFAKNLLCFSLPCQVQLANLQVEFVWNLIFFYFSLCIR